MLYTELKKLGTAPVSKPTVRPPDRQFVRAAEEDEAPTREEYNAMANDYNQLREYTSDVEAQLETFRGELTRVQALLDQDIPDIIDGMGEARTFLDATKMLAAFDEDWFATATYSTEGKRKIAQALKEKTEHSASNEMLEYLNAVIEE